MTKEIIPFSMSAGGDNSFHINCKDLEQQKSYAACIHIEKLSKTDPDSLLYQDCFNAINRRSCEALKMRTEEKEAGCSLYYKKRRGVDVGHSKLKDDPSYAIGWNKAGGKLPALPQKQLGQKPSELATKRKPKAEAASTGIDFADVVNVMTAEAKAPPAPKTQTKTIPGESMIDRAKRIMNERKEATV